MTYTEYMLQVFIYIFWIAVVFGSAYYFWYISQKPAHVRQAEKVRHIVSALDSEKGYTASMFGSKTGKLYIIVVFMLLCSTVFFYVNVRELTEKTLRILAFVMAIILVQHVVNIKKGNIIIESQLGYIVKPSNKKTIVNVDSVRSYTKRNSIFKTVTLQMKDTTKHTIVVTYFSTEFNKAFEIFLAQHHIYEKEFLE